MLNAPKLVELKKNSIFMEIKSIQMILLFVKPLFMQEQYKILQIKNLNFKLLNVHQHLKVKVNQEMLFKH